MKIPGSQGVAPKGAKGKTPFLLHSLGNENSKESRSKRVAKWRKGKSG